MADQDEDGRKPSADEDPAAVTKNPEATPKPARAKTAAATPRGPEEIAADIEKTREELAETLDAIAEKVSPKRVAKRTTKKVTTAVKETASEAASTVKETAGSAKAKVTGAPARSETAWAPEPGPGLQPEVVPELPPTAPVEVPSLASTTYVAPQVLPAPPAATYTASGSLLKPEYIAAGVVAGLLAWLLVRRRRH